MLSFCAFLATLEFELYVGKWQRPEHVGVRMREFFAM